MCRGLDGQRSGPDDGTDTSEHDVLSEVPPDTDSEVACTRSDIDAADIESSEGDTSLQCAVCCKPQWLAKYDPECNDHRNFCLHVAGVAREHDCEDILHMPLMTTRTHSTTSTNAREGDHATTTTGAQNEDTVHHTIFLF